MAVECRELQFEVAGRRFAGFLADGSGGRRVPGVLVAHEGRGFTQHPRDRARMLGELGYVAFSPDYLGEVASSLDHAYELMAPYAEQRELFARHGLAALNVLRAEPSVDPRRLGAIGFCWGGFAALELACHAPLRAVVGFHPGLSLGPVSDAAAIGASVLICVGDADPFVPRGDIDDFLSDMRGGGVDCQTLMLVGAPHSFTNPEPYAYDTGVGHGVGYDGVADRRAWRAMRRLFAEAFGR